MPSEAAHSPAAGLRTPTRSAPGIGLHATAVAIDGRALLIFGRSRAGKSRLAAGLLSASRPGRRIVLVGDDRIFLQETSLGWDVRPHPRTSGFLERRGLGLVAVPWCGCSPLAATATLDEDAAPCVVARRNLPNLNLVGLDEVERIDTVLASWPSSSKQMIAPSSLACSDLVEC